MSRMFAGVLAANAAAPLLYLTLASIRAALSFETSAFSGDPGFAGLIYVGIFFAVFLMVLPASLLFAVLGRSRRWRSVWIYLAGGTAIGAGFALFMDDGRLLYPGQQRRFLIALVIGAICGWIYWRIAVAGSKPKPVT
jgi:hypothetical protein